MRDANNVLRFVMSGGYTSHDESQNGFPGELKATLDLFRIFSSFLKSVVKNSSRLEGG